MKHLRLFTTSALTILIALLPMSADSKARSATAKEITGLTRANLLPAAQDPCQKIIDAIESLEQKKLELQDELNGASGLEITILQKRIAALNLRLKNERAALIRCQEHPPIHNPPLPTLSATLTVPVDGIVAVTDNSNAKGPFTNKKEVVIPLIFDFDRKTATVFPLINIELGSVTIQQLTGITATFDKPTGALDVPARFRILTSFGGAVLDFPFPGLTTESGLAVGPFRPTGMRMDGAGKITLSGASTTTDNFLFGSTHVQVTITGVISPLP